MATKMSSLLLAVTLASTLTFASAVSNGLNLNQSAVVVSDYATQEFFDSIKSHLGQQNCAGRAFYTHQAFLDAVGSFPAFGASFPQRREIAAFFAHVTHETGHFCYVNEINRATYCDGSNSQWPCNPGQKYYGRGPLQVTWNYNYGPAGRSLGFDGLNNPDVLATDPTISFKSALWFWFNRGVHAKLTSGQGFGATIRVINGGECNGGNSAAVDARVGYYTAYCNRFGVTPGDDIRC